MPLAQAFVEAILSMVQRIGATQREAIDAAGHIVANVVAGGGLVHVFGSGHSALLARDVVQRAGGLVPINQIEDYAAGTAERLSGYAACILEPYERQYGWRAGEALILISNSGINPVPVEMAMLARARGLSVIGLTNLEQSRASTSRHPSGQRLFELCDVVLDNCGVPGDAMVAVADTGVRAGPGSTVAGSLLLQMVMLDAMEKLLARGVQPPVLKSQNLEGSDEWNRTLYEKYRGRLRHLGA